MCDLHRLFISVELCKVKVIFFPFKNTKTTNKRALNELDREIDFNRKELNVVSLNTSKEVLNSN